MAIWAAILLIAVAGQAPRHTPRVHVQEPVALQLIKNAVAGARARLQQEDCRRVLSDFQDAEGRPLAERLAASSLTAGDYLLDRVWFVDAQESDICRRDQGTAAFTVPGHQVIRVCAPRFAQKFAHQSVAAELIVIHELLHTLGLGENPPSSRDITQQVMRRCELRPAPAIDFATCSNLGSRHP